MSCFRWITLTFILINTFMEICLAARLGDHMYQNVIGSTACFRRLNGTHQLGCTSASSGSVGVIHVVRSEADAVWIVENGTAPPYTAVMDLNIFNRKIGQYLIDNPTSIAGIVLYYESIDNNKTKPHWYSLESNCPNALYSANGSTCSWKSSSPASSWNSHAMDLMRQEIPFPIFYIPSNKYEDAAALLDCFKTFNDFDLDTQHTRALCAVELSSFMFAASSSEVCHRRTNLFSNINSIKFCDPLADRNIYATLFPRKSSSSWSAQLEVNSVQPMKEEDQSVILLTARLDSASFIDGLSPGAASTVAGLAIYLSTARLLTQMLPPKDANKYSKNIVFALFNGEAFDYIGSQRVAYDMLHAEWPPSPSPPLSAASVALHLEIGQIGGSISGLTAESYPLNAFTPKTSPVVSDAIKNFVDSLSDEGAKLNVNVKTTVTDNLPPSSLHSFRRVAKDGRTNAMAELLITDHEAQFTNQYYHSVLDDADNLKYTYRNKTDWIKNTYGAPSTFRDIASTVAGGIFNSNDTQVRLAKISTAIARAVYAQVTGTKYAGPLEDISPYLIDEILFCYLVSAQCPLFTAALYPLKQADEEEKTLANGHSEHTSKDDRKSAWADYIWPQGKDLPPPAPLYVGVSDWLGAATTGTAHTLALLTGELVPTLFNSTLCTQGNSSDDKYFIYYWMTGWSGKGECYRSTVNYTMALSPAFTVDDYDFSSHEFSSWTESVWRSLGARMFVIPHGRGAKAAFGLGAAITIITLALVVWVKKQSSVLFGELKPDVSSVAEQSRTVQC